MVAVVNPRCCGLDVHKKTVLACVMTPDGQETQTFTTMTRDLLRLGDWLVSREVTHVAMESTGVYWKPIYNVLEMFDLTLLVVNAQRLKAVPGRKTDVKDAEWIADLLRHGLLAASFIPDRPHRDLREIVRARRTEVRKRAQVVNRIQKTLEGGNIKLASVASDVMGVSGRAMLEAMVAGTEDPVLLAALARGKLRDKRAALEEALFGLAQPAQRFLLQRHLAEIDFLDAQIAAFDAEIVGRMHPFDAAISLVTGIPGIGRRGAEEILTEIGIDMSRFPSAGHLASWARICPGNYRSAGKQKGGRTGKGNSWLRSILVEVAWAAARTKDTYLNSFYHRIAARRGTKRALIALAHTILVIIYHLLRDGVLYEDLGNRYYDQRNREAIRRNAVRRLESLGYAVTVTEVA